VVSTHDEGRTWSEPRSLAGAAPGELKDFAPGAANGAIQLRHGPFRGRLMLVVEIRSAVGLILSDDHGRTWRPGALTIFSGACEPSVVELSDGQVIVSPRIGPRIGSQPPARLFLISHDGGASFSETRHETAIPISGQGELVAVDLPATDGSPPLRAIVFCGAAEGKTRLTLIASLDDGRTWPITKMLDGGPCANLALIALPGGQVGILYESDKYLRQRFMRVDLGALIPQR
jgi:sialidase-1